MFCIIFSVEHQLSVIFKAYQTSKVKISIKNVYFVIIFSVESVAVIKVNELKSS